MSNFTNIQCIYSKFRNKRLVLTEVFSEVDPVEASDDWEEVDAAAEDPHDRLDVRPLLDVARLSAEFRLIVSGFSIVGDDVTAESGKRTSAWIPGICKSVLKGFGSYSCNSVGVGWEASSQIVLEDSWTFFKLFMLVSLFVVINEVDRVSFLIDVVAGTSRSRRSVKESPRRTMALPWVMTGPIPQPVLGTGSIPTVRAPLCGVGEGSSPSQSTPRSLKPWVELSDASAVRGLMPGWAEDTAVRLSDRVFWWWAAILDDNIKESGDEGRVANRLDWDAAEESEERVDDLSGLACFSILSCFEKKKISYYIFLILALRVFDWMIIIWMLHIYKIKIGNS